MEIGISDQRAPAAADRPCTEIEYVLEPDDYVACYTFLQQVPRPPPPQVSALRAWHLFVLSAALFGLVAVLAMNQADVHVYVAFLLGALGALLLAIVMARHAAPEPPKNRLAAMTEEVQKLLAMGVLRIGRRNHVVLNGEGFVETNEYRDDGPGVQVMERKETRVPWLEVEGIVAFEHYAIFAVVAKRYLFVPERVFPDETTFRRFVETARALRDACLSRPSENVTLGPVRQVDGRVQTPP
jgi:hypothetical protein